MNTNKANAQNPTFFDDLHRAFDRLEAEFNDCAVVLTGTGRVFSAGLDFDYHFPLFARRSIREVDAWFEGYRATDLRIFTHPRPTVAAINGHTYAGGLITALDCDMRIAAEGDLQFALNEVPIGIPMPAVYCEIIKYAVGAPWTTEITLFGQSMIFPTLSAWVSSIGSSRPSASLMKRSLGPARSSPDAILPARSPSGHCKQLRCAHSMTRADWIVISSLVG
jgi:enoyl-CoA hydratase